MPIRILMAVLLGTLAAAAGAAAAPEALILRRIGSESGLSHNTVFAIQEDRQGFLWIGTVDGLNRYDGYAFVTYRHDPSDPGTLSNQVIRALFEDRAGTLWVGTDNGVNRFDPTTGRFARFAMRGRDGVVARVVGKLYQDRAGTVWAGADRGLFRYDRGHDRFVEHALLSQPGPGAQDVLSLDEDSRGTLWALRGAWQGAGVRFQAVNAAAAPRPTIPLGPEWGRVGGFFFDAQDRLWMNSVPGMIGSAASGLTRLPGYPEPIDTFVTLETRGGELWAGGLTGVWRIDPRTGARAGHELTPGGGWLSNTVRALHEDHTGAVWIGTYTGLYRHDPQGKPFRRWQHDRLDPRSLSSSVVSAVRPAGPAALWLGTFEDGLNRLDLSTGSARRYRNLDPKRLNADSIWDVHVQPDGMLWLATWAGLCSFDPRTERSTWHALPPPPDPGPTPDLRVARIARGPDGTLWLATFAGLYSIDPASGAARRHPLGPEAEPRAYDVSAVLPLADAVWAGSGMLGLFRFDPATGQAKLYRLTTPEGGVLQSEGIWAIHRDVDGFLWLGTGAGLSRFDPRRETFEHYFPRDGLPGSLVYSILEDARRRLWLGTNRGLARFDPGAPPGRRFRTYDGSDGVATTEFNRGAAASLEGTFFFGGIDGLVAFDPDEIRDDTHPPPIALTAIQSSRREGTVPHNPFGLERLVLSHLDSSFAFEFSALSYGNPARNQYAYRLEDFDRDWVAAGTQRFARYTNVPAGEYTFRLRASNHDGIWNEQGLALGVTITPPFWQTWWFRALALTMMLALLAGAYRYRVARLLEMEHVRLRIASDLHDDLSSDLSAIAMVTDMMQRRGDMPPADRSRLTELRDKALQMAGALRDTVWYVQPEHDTMASMVLRMKATATDMLGETPCSFEVALGDDRGAVHMGARRDFFLVYKELIHNVARHARAQQVRVALAEAQGRLTLRVRDDGVGFDPTATYAGEGLRGLRRRAERMGARLEILSRPGLGTDVTVVADLAKTRDGRRATRGV